MTQKPHKLMLAYDQHSIVTPHDTRMSHEQFAQEEEPPPYEPFVDNTLHVAGPPHGAIMPRIYYYSNSASTVEQIPSPRASQNSGWPMAERISLSRADDDANWSLVGQTGPIRAERNPYLSMVGQASPIRAERNPDLPALELPALRANCNTNWSTGELTAPRAGHNTNGPVERTMPRANRPTVESLQPDSPPSCRARMHDTETSFGTFGILAAVICFPIGIGFCLMDKKTFTESAAEPVVSPRLIVTPHNIGMTQKTSKHDQADEPPPYEPFVANPPLPVAGPSYGITPPRLDCYSDPPTFGQLTAPLPPDYPQMACLQAGMHDTQTSFGLLGIIAAVIWFPIDNTACEWVLRPWEQVPRPLPSAVLRTGHQHMIVTPHNTEMAQKSNKPTEADDPPPYEPFVEHLPPTIAGPSYGTIPPRIDYYSDPRIFGQLTAPLPPDHLQTACLQAGMHDTQTSFGLLGIIAAIVWFPFGIGCCLLDRRTVCRRCGTVLSTGFCN
ncbi:hypothetical protein APHAL10511_003786 [Amanita phalloides]|nr:hypothetical protein APHAL10511_003786 [Amanita phalloides]